MQTVGYVTSDFQYVNIKLKTSLGRHFFKLRIEILYNLDFILFIIYNRVPYDHMNSVFISQCYKVNNLKTFILILLFHVNFNVGREKADQKLS